MKEISSNTSDYKPEEMVTWMLPGELPHIGIVVNKKSKDGKRFQLFIMLVSDRF